MSRNGHGSVVVGNAEWRATASLEEIQAVWASVSANPLISVRCLAQQTGITKTRIHHILHFLEDAGYLQHQPHCMGRRVRIPMIWIERTTPPKQPLTEAEAG
jgi:hypothetical protein